MEIRAFFNRNWRYLVFALVTFLVFWVLYTWRAILLPFLIGLLLAYLMAPIVRFVERRLPGKGRWAEAKRVSVILFLMVLFLGIFAFAVFILVTTLLHSSANMIANASQLINDLIARGKEWTQAIRNLFPASMQAQVEHH